MNFDFEFWCYKDSNKIFCEELQDLDVTKFLTKAEQKYWLNTLQEGMCMRIDLPVLFREDKFYLGNSYNVLLLKNLSKLQTKRLYNFVETLEEKNKEGKE